MGCLKPAKSLGQTMWFPALSHNLSCQPMHVIRNILQDGSIAGSSQVTKLSQLLIPFTVYHIENTLDTQNGEAVI
jgi:hypothetical protein